MKQSKLYMKQFFASSLSLALSASLVPSVQASGFSDVTSSDWYYSYVTDMANLGYITGTTETTYNPMDSLSVAAFSVMISNAFYGNTLERELLQNTGSWWFPYLQACSLRHGLTGTVAETSSSWDSVANASISCYDMAEMIANLLSDRGVTLLSTSEVNDVIASLPDSVESSHQSAVATAFHYGFLSGRSDGSFDGSANLTRGEAAVVLSALVNTSMFTTEAQGSGSVQPEAQLPDMGQMGDQGQMGQLPDNGQLPDMGQMGDQGQMGQLPDNGQLPDMGQMGDQGQMGQLPDNGQLPDMGQMGDQGQMGQLPDNGQLPDMGQMGDQGQMGQLPDNGQMGGQGQTGSMPQAESTYTVAEALSIANNLISAVGYRAEVGGYAIVDTNQTTFYSIDAIISAPSVGEAFYGQDASHSGNQQNYTDNGNGTVTDNVTGLTWQQDPGAKMTWPEAVANLDAFNGAALGGYSDWRIPTMKELYSLVDFSGLTGTSSSSSVPYINTDYFVFTYGDQAGEARFIDSQILTSTIYNSTTLGNNTTVFGYNFADGRIKGYEIDKDFYCYYVRGNTSYGENLFMGNGDETISDLATSLMWMEFDSGYYGAGDISDGTMDWAAALAYAQEMNDQNFLGYSDWRLPNVKELHSLTDYSKSPAVTGEPSMDSLFYCTPIINYFGEKDYGFYWSGTTHDDLSASSTRYGAASYMVFGDSMGEMNHVTVDAHGSGAQRSDPKTGSRDEYPAPDPNAPQGDEQRVFNMVRLVRDI